MNPMSLYLNLALSRTVCIHAIVLQIFLTASFEDFKQSCPDAASKLEKKLCWNSSTLSGATWFERNLQSASKQIRIFMKTSGHFKTDMCLHVVKVYKCLWSFLPSSNRELHVAGCHYELLSVSF
jgi:hypothetical protein